VWRTYNCCKTVPCGIWRIRIFWRSLSTFAVCLRRCPRDKKWGENFYCWEVTSDPKTVFLNLARALNLVENLPNYAGAIPKNHHSSLTSSGTTGCNRRCVFTPACLYSDDVKNEWSFTSTLSTTLLYEHRDNLTCS
jgi:hypothetical protein